MTTVSNWPAPAVESAPLAALSDRIDAAWLVDEAQALNGLLPDARTEPALTARVAKEAERLVRGAREREAESSGLHAFLQHYDLSSSEGVVLMCLAEALLRIPDSDTADRLIAEKLSAGDWARHLGESGSLFVNASTWALMLTGRSMAPDDAAGRPGAETLKRLLARVEEPVVRAALRAGMRILAEQFVMGRTIADALERTGSSEERAWRHTFDILGEAALTAEDARRYFEAYAEAVTAIGTAARDEQAHEARPSLSVKLSALSPRYEPAQRERAVDEVAGRLLELARIAAPLGVGLTVDAEEAERLELALEAFARVHASDGLGAYAGLGIAVQAYQKRASPQLCWLQALARERGRAIPVRLVKGAYWDTEIKRAQERALPDYPVFTRKRHTDVSYLACARLLLERCPDLYPQFATHNAHTVAWLRWHGRGRAFEYQRLHGMGEALYRTAMDDPAWDRPCRVYAPVGPHEDLLPYLVRRLLENGANTSFVNQLADRRIEVAAVTADPVQACEAHDGPVRRPDIPPPCALWPGRRAAMAPNFAQRTTVEAVQAFCAGFDGQGREAVPLVGGERLDGTRHPVCEPAASGRLAGFVDVAEPELARRAVDVARHAFRAWNARPADARARVLERGADLLEAYGGELTDTCMREAGKTLRDAHADVREAIDFLRFYAVECRRLFSAPVSLPGPAGESNTLSLTGRGVFACISPWNFPAALFTGQVAAALASGNTVVAKPAPQTPLTAARIVALLHDAGVPGDALAFLPGDAALGEALTRTPGLAGVAFTGSLATARRIQRTLADAVGALPALVAETGGVNVLVADSSALPEQLVADCLVSAYNSAGQRCSALRLLYVQSAIHARVVSLLEGAMDELVVGDPRLFPTDVGPVIDAPARARLDAHLARLGAKVRHRAPLGRLPAGGHYFAPALADVDGIGQLPEEVFGPVLHVAPFERADLDAVLDAVAASGYGLTLGIHSRVEATVRQVLARARVGNVYVNRNMVGAVVGSQPFGGMGLSGTGPKTGGPHTLLRFATEQTVTVNTAAVGGNAALLNRSQGEDV